MPAAARKGDTDTGHDGFPPTPITSASPDVEIDGIPAARMGDALAPHDKPKSPPHGRAIAGGSSTVFINGQPAARVGDAVDCGGSIVVGSGTVVIDENTPISFGGAQTVYAATPCVRQCMKQAGRKGQAFVGGS